MAASILELRGVTREFSAAGGRIVRAVDDVSMQVAQGEFVTVLGPSGCGKTTLLRLIGGFDVPTRGDILFEGRRINHLPPNRRDTAMVFQNYALFPHMNVFDNIAYGLKTKGTLTSTQIRTRVQAMLELVGLKGLEARSVHQLSGGEQQRVALARALIREPKVLLFDEPLSNLDARLRVQMRGELRRLQRQTGITSIYVTHDQEEAMTLSDRIVVMQAGRILQVGTPKDVYEHPRTLFVAEFIGRHTNLLPARIQERLPTGHVVVDLLGSRLAIPGGRGGLSGTVAMIRPEAVAVRRLDSEEGAVWCRDDQARGDTWRVTGQISVVTYLGGQAVYEIELVPQGRRLVAEVSDPARQGLLPVGTMVEAVVAASSVHLIADSQGPETS